VNTFVEELTQFYSDLDKAQMPIRFEYDFEIAIEECQTSLLKWLDVIGPYGQGFPTPLFLLKNVNVKSIFELKGGHLKFKFSNNSAAIISRGPDTEDESIIPEGLFFSPPAYLKRPQPKDLVDLIGELQWNYFAGKTKIQFLIRDLKLSPLQSRGYSV
jgi:single-stranded-DNA-specific exonuclease